MTLSYTPTKRPSLESQPNGLQSLQLSGLYTTKAAALIRVHAGAHDAPEAYPGLAHFLEHLLFLGSQNYTVENSLMAFVQGCGGQLNASTRERHTDFFFQVPAERLEDGLLRLLDMLSHPLLDAQAQLREREVLHAEYLARSQDVETLCDAALGRAFGTHPFSGFHAGCRETLPVEDEAFQEALRGYHHKFYRSGQIELLLAGPQNAIALHELASMADRSLPAGGVVSRVPPALRCARDEWLRLQIDDIQPQLNLAFVLDALPVECAQVVHYFSTWISSEAEHSLMQCLRREGLCQSMRPRVPYWYSGQGIIVVELTLTDRGLSLRSMVVAAVLDWLRYFSSESVWEQCIAEYRRIVTRSLEVAEPLALLRHWVEPLAWSETSEDEALRRAFGLVVDQMLEAGPLILTVDSTPCGCSERFGFALRMASEPSMPVPTAEWAWQCPAPNPWLQPPAVISESTAHDTALEWQGPEQAAGQGAVFLLWHFSVRPESRNWLSVWHALQPPVKAAQQAGVVLRFEDSADCWSLSLCGCADALPSILSDIIPTLDNIPAASQAAGAALSQRSGVLGASEMLIRTLLKRLPTVLGATSPTAEMTSSSDRSTRLNPWRTAHWHGLAVGLPPHLRGSVNDALRAMPGTPISSALLVPSTQLGRRWEALRSQERGETALLLFCPLPNRSAACEAAWRVLASLLESAFYRRMRSELQLGYAVFSRYHTVGQYSGLLFGVQSPSATAADIHGHIEGFLDDFAASLASHTATSLNDVTNESSRRYRVDPADFHPYAEQAWQARLAGHEPDRPERVAEAMKALKPEDISIALESLRCGAGGWIVVSNADRPDQT